MRMQKKQFRIGALAKELALEKFVIRFWEKEFNIKSQRSNGGQRYYTYDDVQRFKQIKELLYHKKFTIAGAKEILQEKQTGILASTRTTLPDCKQMPISKKELLTLRTQLQSLKNILSNNS